MTSSDTEINQVELYLIATEGITVEGVFPVSVHEILSAMM
jgi:hypothetical protein